MYVDTHVHLNDERLYANLETVIAEALGAHLSFMVCVGYDRASSQLALKIAEQYPFVAAAIGIHPTEVKNLTEDDYTWLKNTASSEKVVAIGEIGLDYHWDKTTAEDQETSFRRQLEIAKTVQKPVIIHTREATQKTYEILKDYYRDLNGGIMHNYSGSLEMAREFISFHFYLGIGGVLTFKNAREIKRVVQEIDLSHLVTETDAPYLTPHPYRGMVNYPKYIPLIVQEIASLKQISVEEAAKTIRQNAMKLFRIEKDI